LEASANLLEAAGKLQSVVAEGALVVREARAGPAEEAEVAADDPSAASSRD
jgi:hypothetical protein